MAIGESVEYIFTSAVHVIQEYKRVYLGVANCSNFWDYHVI